jgi:hypothetical protein
MTEHERLLSILGAVPGIRTVVERVTEPFENGFDFRVHVICSDSGETITIIYTHEEKSAMRVGSNISKVVEDIIMRGQWSKITHNLTLAIDLLTAYRDEVKK